MITHTLNTIPTDKTKIVVTRHCLNRFLERYRLHLTLTETQSNHMAIDAIRKLVMTKGVINRKFEFSPFFQNKCQARHNRGKNPSNPQTIIIKTPVCHFIAKKEPDCLVLVTAVRNP